MFSTLRNRFGIPGVISVIALVFAMFGGAYAATNSSGSGKATASAKAKKGPRGPKGATGPAGPAGPQGPAGANGKDGANGSNGSNGATGAAGQSVTSVTELAGANCANGGYKLTSASGTQYVCNGAKGATGPTGPTGPEGGGGGGGGFAETLPSGKTETGAFLVRGEEKAAEIQLGAPVSWSIPLTQVAAEAIIFHLTDADGDATCTGSSIHPTAPTGKLCFYVTESNNLANFEVAEIAPYEQSQLGKVSTSGAFIAVEVEGLSKSRFSQGSFAITAP
jgi:hypothetical protein